MALTRRALKDIKFKSEKSPGARDGALGVLRTGGDQVIKTIKSCRKRTESDRSKLSQTVSQMITHVRERGDMALREYNKRFDRCEREDLRISRAEIERAYEKVTEEEISDIKRAAANIRAFAQAQRKTVDRLFACSRSDIGSQSDTCRFVLLLCAGRRLSAVFHRSDAGHTRQDCRRQTCGSLLAGDEGQPRDTP